MRLLAALLLLPLLGAGLAAFALPHTAPAAPPAVPLAPRTFTHLVCPDLAGTKALPLEKCNVRATVDSGPANEIDLALDPKDPLHMVVVGKGYKDTRLVGSDFNGGVITPYATSFDGGLTWTEGFLQSLGTSVTLPVLGDIGATPHRESDPVVEFAPDGSLLVLTLRVGGGGGLPLYRSTDGGLTFTEFANAYPHSTDKEWIVADRVSGNLYLATLDDQGGMGFEKSSDGGATWSAPVHICDCVFPAIDVGPKGEIYAVGFDGSNLQFTKSLDRGATWTPARVIQQHNAVDWNTGNLRAYRTTNIQQLAVDPASGALYLVWAQHPLGSAQVVCLGLPPPGVGCVSVPDTDIVLSRSTDGGATWSAPQVVNDDATSPVSLQFMPAVAVSPRGDVHVAWLDQRNDPTGLTTQTYYAHSSDGVHFDANLLVSDLPSPTVVSHHQSATNLNFVGDYLGLSATDGKAVVAWPDGRYGRDDIFVATIQ